MRFLDLGPLRIERDGGDQVTAGGRRPAALLTMLLLHANHRVSVDDLIEAVWGENLNQAAASTLETHVWRLRRILEPGRSRGAPASVLLNDSGGYRLVVTSEQVDTLRFEQLGLEVLDLLSTGQANRALGRADEALGLWRGRPFDLLADAYWASGPIARLEEIRAQIQERRVDALLATAQPTRALAELETLLAASPFRERLWGQRMLALHRSGRTEEALQTYHTARLALQDEIGIDPGQELNELQQRILEADPALQLPRPTTPTPDSGRRPAEVHLPRPRVLIGRDHDVTALSELVAAAPLVNVVGPAGCGKTRLAVEAARTAAQHFPDGVWFVDLTTAEDGATVADAVSTTLGLAVPAAATALQILASHAQDYRALVVLDNCEHVLDAVADLVEDVTGQGQELSLLATSREPLGVAHERLYRIGPLPLTASGGEPVPAVELFLQRLSAGRDHVDADPVHLAQVERICRAVDGIPLALELAAGLTEAYTLGEVADQVAADPSQLASVGRGHDRHHRTLYGAIHAGYRLLTFEEQVLHRRLSVLSGPFTTATAAAVAAPLPARRVSGLLAQLVHRSMLTSLGSNRGAGPTRFTQLATIRSHAAHLLSDDGETAATEHLHIASTLDLVRRRPRAGRLESASWLDALDDDATSLRAALQRSVDSSDIHGEGAEIARNTLGYWYYRGLTLEGRRWLTQLVENPRLATHDLALTRLALASLLVIQGEVDAARSLVDLAAPVCEVPPDGRAIETAEHLLNAAASFAFAPDPAVMHRLLAVADAIARATGDADLRVVHASVACMADSLTEPVEETLVRARRCYDEARQVGNLWAGWFACSSGSGGALQLRDPEQGMWWSRRLLEQQYQLGARAPLAQLETWGDFLAMAGHHARAVQVFAATHHQSRRSGLRFPRHLVTSGLLQDARGALGERAFEAAWRAGPVKPLDELLESAG